MKKYNKLFAILFAVLGVQTLSAQTEIISNGNNLNKQHNFGSVSSHTIPELWCDDARQGFNFSQAVELPNGVYTLSFQMMYRASLTAGTSTNCALYAETSGEVYNTPIKNFADEEGTAESLSGVTDAMNSGKYLNTIPYFVVTDGRVTVGARSLGALTRCTNGYWLIWNPASFKLVSVVDNTILTNALNEVKAEAKAVLDGAAASDAKTKLQSAYDAATATADGIVTLKKAIRAYLPNTGTAANPVDVSSLMLSADFSQKAFIVATKNNNGVVTTAELQPVGWTCTDGSSGQYNFFNVVDNNVAYDGQSNFAYNGKTTGQTLYMRQAWADNVTISAKQTITFPNGRYKVSIPAKKTGNNAYVKYTFAGSTETHNVTTSWAVYEKIFTANDTNNTLTIELSYHHPSGGGQRAFFDGVTLLSYGDPIAALLTEITTKANALKAYNGTIPTEMYNSFSANLSAAENASNTQSENDLQTIIDNLEGNIATAKSVVTPYASLKSLIDLCTEYTDNKNSNANSDEVLTTFQTAISYATTAGDNATSADAINTAYNDLESARQTYARNAVPVYPYPFDMTFMLPNTTFDSNTEGWTQSGGASWMSAGNVECYNTTFEFSMEYEGLNQGSWEIQVDAFYRYGGYDDAEKAYNGGTEQLLATLYANNNTVAVKSIMEGANAAGDYGQKTAGGVYVPNWPDQCDTYFATGCYTNAIATVIADGKLKVGIKKETTQGSDWTIFDNFKLIYKGVDITDLQDALSELIEKANAIKDTKMGATESAALTDALTAADAENTNADDLGTMISTLQSAYEAAVPSIDLYATVLPYITKAEGVDASIATTYRNQYENGTITETAETVFQKLEVATYNYVTNNFAYPVALSDTWNSKGTNTQAATFSNEHWSGTTREYKNQDDNNGQGWNAQAWSIDFDQSVTLPAGDYVFKVAGRKSAGTTLELVVTMGETTLGTVNDFPSSNNARGINKAGAASFDPEDPAEFANNGNGFGWQWRYVKFTLDAEATVKVAVHAEANAYNNWVSFGDYTLQMTEETYLEANKGGLDAPTAAANSLVDTKPMGTTENTALKDALDLPVTTGAELLAKIEALETAVANANAWVTAYNEAKAPLVAALDRFEADYNDAQNGALNHMNKDRWATAISMAQDAAVAKDATDSYEGFAAATEELVAALDAAQVSVDEYAALKSAIDNAEELGGGDDWGDEPFQKSESAKESFNTTKTEAQTAYNAAEVDGEGVTTVIESLNTAINKVVLNAPEEGQRYYIKVATEGHGKKDNAWLVTLGATGDNNPTGYGINANNAVKGHLNQAFIFTQVEGNLYNISIERAEGTVYLTYGALNGSAADWKNQQIQATTDAEKKGEFKIVPTGKKGILKILNTIDNNYLDCQGGGSIYTDTGIENEEFAFELATETEVTLTLSEVGWATLILPFDAELPEGVKAYSCTEADGETLTLTEAESLKANTPYLMNGEKSTHVFTGYGLADKDSYTDGLFTGTYVDYQTTADSKTYVLQNQDGNLAFYLVTDAVQPWIRAYRSYMVYKGAAGAPKFSLGRGEGTTSIDKAQLTIDNVVIYDLMGRKVSTMEKGGVYIVNGKKVVIK